MDRPFILIASLNRTGSTVLGEALTQLPHCFIFPEPRMNANRFSLIDADIALFSKHGVRLSWYRRFFKLTAHMGISTASMFQRWLLPRLEEVVRQVGAKEIHLKGWERYHRAFPDMRVLLTGRDPRDIYISMRERVDRGQIHWPGAFTPGTVAAHLNAEFRHQARMHDTVPCMKVRYEDLCRDPAVLERAKEFTGCEVPGQGAVGKFTSAESRRTDEHELHGDRITDRRVDRWRSEKETRLHEIAREITDLMPDYCEFWGYGD